MTNGIITMIKTKKDRASISFGRVSMACKRSQIVATVRTSASNTCNEIVAARSGRPILPLELLSLRKIVPATVTYIGLSTWTLGRKTLRQVARGNDNLKPIELALVAIGCVRLR